MFIRGGGGVGDGTPSLIRVLAILCYLTAAGLVGYPLFVLFFVDTLQLQDICSRLQQFNFEIGSDETNRNASPTYF